MRDIRIHVDGQTAPICFQTNDVPERMGSTDDGSWIKAVDAATGRIHYVPSSRIRHIDIGPERP